MSSLGKMTRRRWKQARRMKTILSATKVSFLLDRLSFVMLYVGKRMINAVKPICTFVVSCVVNELQLTIFK